MSTFLVIISAILCIGVCGLSAMLDAARAEMAQIRDGKRPDWGFPNRAPRR